MDPRDKFVSAFIKKVWLHKHDVGSNSLRDGQRVAIVVGEPDLHVVGQRGEDRGKRGAHGLAALLQGEDLELAEPRRLRSPAESGPVRPSRAEPWAAF